MLTRRRLLKTLGAGATLSCWPALGADTAGPRRLVVVILRGGMDGLSAVPAWGDPRFESLRGALSTGTPGGEDGTLKLDGTFGLHPGLKQLAGWYREKSLAIVHAAAPPYQGRSHFEAQDCLENGTAQPHGAHDGWLNRAVAGLRGAEGLAIASAMPLMLRGPAPTTTWSPSPLEAANPDLVDRLAPLYARDTALATAFRRAAESDTAMASTQRALRLPLPAAMRQAGDFLRADNGPRVALIEDSGWDTHAGQGARNGRIARKLASLDEGLAGLRDKLGPAWAHSAVVAVTEFGRTVAVNGSGGTDHGTGSAMFVAGGTVAGGRVLGEWRGLAALRDGRDLPGLNDTRSVFKSLLLDHLQLAESTVETRVFPDSRAAKPLAGLLS